MSIIGIYKILNLKNNKVYIGSSFDVKARLRTHRNQLKTNVHGNSHLQYSYNKYGKDNFSYSIIKIVENCSSEELEEIEESFIKLYEATNRAKGYNKREKCNTNKGLKWPEESKRKFSESKKGIKLRPWHAEKIRLANIGVKRKKSTEMLNALRNNIKKAQEFNCKKVDQYTLDYKYIASYNSIIEAAEATNTFSGSIGAVCRKERVKAGNFIWKYHEENFNPKKRSNSRYYNLFDKNKNLLEIVFGKNILKEKYNIEPQSVNSIIMTKRLYKEKYYIEHYEPIDGDVYSKSCELLETPEEDNQQPSITEM
jgi:group I intron endonuclease